MGSSGSTQYMGFVKQRISYFNIPASGVAGHPDNPWRYVLDLVQPGDYVLAKLDIDTPSVEMPLVRQLLNSTRPHGLVTEFVFEHHVDLHPGGGGVSYWSAHWTEGTRHRDGRGTL